jgi:hypothetical protein
MPPKKRSGARGHGLPKITSQAILDRRAMVAVESEFLENGGHLLDRHSLDFGVDGSIIFNFRGRAAGYRTYLQVKGTETRDTETKLGFKYPCKVKTIRYLQKQNGPAYFAIYNAIARTLYVRPVYEMVAWLNACRGSAWEEGQRTVTLTFLNSSRLTAERIRRFAVEARAWSENEEIARDVRYLRREVSKYATVRSTAGEKAGESYVWMSLRGSFTASGTADVVNMLLVLANLMHGLSLCSLYEARTSGAYEPAALSTSGLGTMDLADLAERLSRTVTQHKDLLKKFKEALAKTKPSPKDNSSWTPPRHSGLATPPVEKLDAKEAAKQVVDYLRSMGLQVVIETGNLELMVKCGKATGLLSFRGYGRPTKPRLVQELRARVGSVAASAAAFFIKLCQLESIGLDKWKKPDTPPKPPIPIGTVSPNLDDFLSALLEGAIAAGSWPEAATLSATQLVSARVARMPSWTQPDQDNALDYQKKMAQRYAMEALRDVRLRMPFTFTFHWGLQRLESFILIGPAELISLVLLGPVGFHELGGCKTQAGPQ